MGDYVVTDGSPKIDLPSKFREAFPIYMLMGMSYDEYWEGDPYLCVYYRKLWQMKTDRENYMAWISGLYNYSAFGSVLANAFKKKGEKPESYLKEPIPIRPKTEEEERLEREAKIQKIVNQLNARKKAFDNKNKGDK